MTLRVDEISGLATVQDLGRPGHAHAGVPAGGAADALSLRLANRAVGNDAGAAAVELAIGPMRVRAESGCTVCVTSGPRAFEAVELAAGQSLEVAPDAGLCRAYLAVAGGIDVPVVLGSRCTLLGAGFGGLEGRALRSGDAIHVGKAGDHAASVPLAMRAMAGFAARRRVLRVVTDGAEAPLPAGVLRVSPNSDRVGVRLDRTGAMPEAQPLAHSRGVMHGTIQMPSAHELVILGPDGPTTGGYPTVGVVIAADLPAVGQLCPGQWLQLEAVTRKEAVSRLLMRANVLRERV
jgi:biotin-dependent carboxylase-like uncharacterized protein